MYSDRKYWGHSLQSSANQTGDENLLEVGTWRRLKRIVTNGDFGSMLEPDLQAGTRGG